MRWDTRGGRAALPPAELHALVTHGISKSGMPVVYATFETANREHGLFKPGYALVHLFTDEKFNASMNLRFRRGGGVVELSHTTPGVTDQTLMQSLVLLDAVAGSDDQYFTVFRDDAERHATFFEPHLKTPRHPSRGILRRYLIAQDTGAND